MLKKPEALLSARQLLLASAAALIVDALLLMVPWVRRHALLESIVLTVGLAAALYLLAQSYGWLSQHRGQLGAAYRTAMQFRAYLLLGLLALVAVLTGYVVLSG